eukprot:2440488-Alexandrium_andersonii.AAC.1
MASQQTIVPYAQSASSQSLRPAAWPNDVLTSGQISACRSPFIREATLYVLSPEAAHGVALEFLAKRDETTPLRIYGHLG